jgi:hypothetical protein
LPSDDTGVAHILEHSVLSGSRRFMRDVHQRHDFPGQDLLSGR